MGAGPDPINRALFPRVREILDDVVGPDACELYVDACEVVAAGDSRARRLMAAAGIREILDLIEEAAGYEHQPPDGRAAIAKLEKAWRVAQRTETGSGSGLAAFEPTLEDFFGKFRNIPPRRELSLGTLRHFDPILRESSPLVQEERVGRWAALRRDFSNIVHRKRAPSMADFSELLETFEEFLVRWLRPPTTADQLAIDELLRGGPPRG